MDIHKYLKYLTSDELATEYAIRGIDLNDPDAKQCLSGALESEITDPNLIPSKSHITETPELEIGTAREIAEDLGKSLHGTDSIPLETLEAVVCRSIHWRRCMERLKTSFGSIANVINITTKFKRIGQSAQALLEQAESARERDRKTDPPKPIDMPGAQYSDDIITSSLTTSAWPITFPPPTFSLAPGDNRLANTNNVWSNPILDQPPHTNQQTNFRNWFPLAPPVFPSRSANNSVPQHRSMPMNDDVDMIGMERERIPGFAYSPRNQLPKWKISFDGTSRGLEVHDFLFRLETFAKRDGYPMNRLPLIIHAFVAETAEKWLWVYTRNNPDATWDDLKNAFFSRFSDHETERETKRFIERRTQKFRESFNDFSLEIQSCNGRLTNWFSEIELIEIIRENMSAGLKSATLTMRFDTIEQLRMVCQKFERVWSSSGFDPRNQATYHNQRHSVNELTPTIDPNQLSIEGIKISESNESNAIAAIRRAQPRDCASETNVICWNCKDIGHRYQDCLHEFSTVFCFGCGKPGVRKPSCSNCAQYLPLNRTPNVDRSGISRSGSYQLDPRNQPTGSQTNQSTSQPYK